MPHFEKEGFWYCLSYMQKRHAWNRLCSASSTTSTDEDEASGNTDTVPFVMNSKERMMWHHAFFTSDKYSVLISSLP